MATEQPMQTDRADSDSPPPLPRLLWIIEHGSGLATLAGLAIYAIVRLGYDAFYTRLGVTPEDVGVSYSVVVTRAVLGVFVGAAVYLVINCFIHWRDDNSARHESTAINQGVQFSGQSVLVAIGVLSSLAIASFFVGDFKGSQAQDGHAVRPAALSLNNAHVFGFSAEPIELTWLNGSPAGFPPVEQLLFLGQSGSTIVLYDTKNDRPIRIPAGSVVLALK